MDLLRRLKTMLAELAALRAAAEVLEWDQQVMLPPGGAADRASQCAALRSVLHRRSQSPALGRLLDRIPDDAGSPEDRALVRRARRDFFKSNAVPVSLAVKLARTGAAAYDAWLRARAADDFAGFAPLLERMLELKRAYAERFRTECLYDALLDDYEEGMTAAELDSIFSELREEQLPIVRAAADRGGADGVLPDTFPATRQRAFARRAVRRLGYDFRRGRLDETAHPFTITLGAGDVRITTAVEKGVPLSAFFSAVHECGHALYEQGIAPEFAGTPLADGASFGFHESQSRFYENQLARSEPFWEYFYPQLRRSFPAARSVPQEEFLRRLNRVTPSLIRTEADEATYNLHILLRYELERGLIDGRCRVADLPELWRGRMAELLGIEPANDRDGVLQDVHWACGDFGYFPSYALGNLIAGELYEKIRCELPEYRDAVRRGEFGLLREYLRREIHQYGARFSPRELHRKLFGTERISPAPYLRYLKAKFVSGVGR